MMEFYLLMAYGDFQKNFFIMHYYSDLHVYEKKIDYECQLLLEYMIYSNSGRRFCQLRIRNQKTFFTYTKL